MKFAEEKRNPSCIIRGSRLKRNKTKESIDVPEKEVIELEEKKWKLK